MTKDYWGFLPRQEQRFLKNTGLKAVEEIKPPGYPEPEEMPADEVLSAHQLATRLHFLSGNITSCFTSTFSKNFTLGLAVLPNVYISTTIRR